MPPSQELQLAHIHVAAALQIAGFDGRDPFNPLADDVTWWWGDGCVAVRIVRKDESLQVYLSGPGSVVEVPDQTPGAFVAAYKSGTSRKPAPQRERFVSTVREAINAAKDAAL